MKQATVNEAIREAFNQYEQEVSGLTREAWRTRQVYLRLGNAARELGRQFCITRTLFDKLNTSIPKDHETSRRRPSIQ